MHVESSKNQVTGGGEESQGTHLGPRHGEDFSLGTTLKLSPETDKDGAHCGKKASGAVWALRVPEPYLSGLWDAGSRGTASLSRTLAKSTILGGEAGVEGSCRVQEPGQRRTWLGKDKLSPMRLTLELCPPAMVVVGFQHSNSALQPPRGGHQAGPRVCCKPS